MPSQTKKNTKNRVKELRRVLSEAKPKQRFELTRPSMSIPDQKIQLYHKNLRENFQGQQLKEFDPAEYMKQKMKLKAHRNLLMQKYNTRKRSNFFAPSKAAPLSLLSSSPFSLPPLKAAPVSSAATYSFVPDPQNNTGPSFKPSLKSNAVPPPSPRKTFKERSRKFKLSANKKNNNGSNFLAWLERMEKE